MSCVACQRLLFPCSLRAFILSPPHPACMLPFPAVSHLLIFLLSAPEPSLPFLIKFFTKDSSNIHCLYLYLGLASMYVNFWYQLYTLSLCSLPLCNFILQMTKKQTKKPKTLTSVSEPHFRQISTNPKTLQEMNLCYFGMKPSVCLRLLFSRKKGSNL